MMRYFFTPKNLFAVSFLYLMAGWGCKQEPPVVPPGDFSLITEERELTDGEQPAVSPDGTKIAFMRTGDIFVMDTSGTNITQLTNSGEYDLMPRWHPNGMTVGFIRRNEGEYNKGKLFTVPSGGGAAIQLLADNHVVGDSLFEHLTRYSGIGASIWNWSPDGGLVAFLQQIGYTTFLNVVNTTNNEQIYYRELWDELAGNRSDFTWATTNEIAFIGQHAQGGRRVFLFNLSTQVLLQDSSHPHPNFVTKNPLDNAFAYWSFENIVITNFSSVLAKFTRSSGEGGLKWSPNGRYILFEDPVYNQGPFAYRESRVGMYDLESQKQYVLTKDGDINRVNYFYDWGKSSQAVYFERYGKILVVYFKTPS